MDSLARLGQHSDSEELTHAIKRIDIRPPAGFYKTDDSQIDPAKLWEVAKDKQTPEMVARAVEHSAVNLKYASKRQMTREVCMDAVSRYGAMLKYVPKKMLDEKICRIAFDQDPTAILSMPEQYQTLEMWKAAVRTSQWMISSVPEQYLNESVCLSAVSANGMALEQIPERMKNARICLEAVKQNGLSLEHVPPSKRSSRVCKAAVKSDGMALQFVPQKSIDANLIQDAVSSSGSSLQFLPTNRRTRTRCELAISNDPRALEYVPDKFKTEELCSSILNCYPALIRFAPEPLRTPQRCQTAVESSWDLLSYVPEETKSVDICTCAFNQNWRALRYFPAAMFTQETLVETLSRAKEEIEDSEFGRESIRKSVVEVCAICPHEILDTPLIARLEREIGIRKTLSKRFESETKEFVVREMERQPEWLLCERNIEKRFEDFKSFLEYVEYDLDGADLTGYDFKGEETSELNLTNAKISLELIGTLSAKMSLYDHIEHLYDDDSEEPPNVSSADTLIHASELDEFDPESQRRIFYVSDIHLDHCIANRFRERVSDAEIRDYVKGLVDQLVEERRKYNDRTYQEILVNSFLDRGRSSFSPERVVKGVLLIGGDISHSFAFSEIFFTELAKRWRPQDVIIVLGNHELWEYEPGFENTAERNVDRTVDKYRQLVEPLGMHLVQNELLVYLRNCQWVKFTEDEILDESKRYAIQHAAARSSISIFGGLGFSGLSPKYNATLGIYRNAITSAEDDIRLTERFRTLYNRIVEILGGKRIVVFTHTPYWNWSGNTPVPIWWYVSGHTHHNQYRNDESLSLFADNQIGYHSTELSLKHFIVRKKYDIFEPYGDGIYLIDDNQYVAFNRGLGIDCQFSRGNQVTMLKRSNFYMFLFEANDKLFLLEGGRIRTLDHQDSLYYYERMQAYADIVKAAMGTYMEALKKISKAVKAFGGEGYIHGSIVDIDCFNHVYLNPFDGKISYYYATSIVDKVFYDDAYALLREHAPWLLTGYTTFLLNNLGAGHDEVTMPANAGEQLAEVKKAARIIDTTMYQPSRVMRSIQYLFDTNVIRVWNEEALQTGAPGNVQTEKTIAGSRSTPKPLHS